MDYDAEAIRRHRETRGKVSIASKMPVETMEDLSIAYTPGVAAVSLAIAADKSETNRLTNRGNTVAVITDGSAVLGLGNIGPEAALPVMEGKSILFKGLADIDAFPICLATQDSAEIIQTVKRLAPTFGASTSRTSPRLGVLRLKTASRTSEFPSSTTISMVPPLSCWRR